MSGMIKDPQTGNKIRLHEKNPGNISRARCVLTGCLLKYVLIKFPIALNRFFNLVNFIKALVETSSKCSLL